jgi:2-dehydropantoate 2-reductase
MNYLIIGAGGIGCYYGARLQRAGHSVSYVARGDNLKAMQKNGLQVKHPDIDFLEKVEVFSIHELVKNKDCSYYDLIILTTKSGSTFSILEYLRDWLDTATTPFLSLQNGVDNESLISDVVGIKRTLGGLAVRIGGHIVSPGKIEAKGEAQIIIGYWPNTKDSAIEHNKFLVALADELNSASIPTKISLDIKYELWRKLLINNGVNPLSALTGLDTKALTCHPVLTDYVYLMMKEVASVAKVDNVILSQVDIDEMYHLICSFDAIKTSMLVDKEKGRTLELDSICGAVLQRASMLGVETPITKLVNSLLMLQNGNK